jgi:hypothetical protein
MENYMYSWKGTSEIAIDPNNVVINKAGTNMTVATYPTSELNRGNTKPVFEPFRELTLGPNNRAKLEEIFKAEQAKLKKTKKTQKSAARLEKKNKKVVMAQ